MTTAPRLPSSESIGDALTKASPKGGQYERCVLAAASQLVTHGFGIDNTSEESVRGEFSRIERPLSPETKVVIRSNPSGPAAEIGCTVCGHVVAMYGVVDAQVIGSPVDPRSPDCPLIELVASTVEDETWLVE